MHAYTLLCDAFNRAHCKPLLAKTLQQLVHQPEVHTVCGSSISFLDCGCLSHQQMSSFRTDDADDASQGIKVTDADSKKKAIKLLKAEQAMKQMDIDSDASDSGSDVEMK